MNPVQGTDTSGQSSSPAAGSSCCESMTFALSHAIIRRRGPCFGADVLPAPLTGHIVACPWCGAPAPQVVTPVRLIHKGGYLYIPEAVATAGDPLHRGDRLVMSFVEGEAICPRWPRPWEEDLRTALFDARECGLLPAGAVSVLLPDGKEFQID